MGVLERAHGGYLTADPAAVSGYASGRVDVFVRGTDGALWSRYITNGGTSWGDWYRIGGYLLDGTGPTAYAWANDRIGWLVTGTDHALWHMWNDAAGRHGWESLSGYLTSSPATTSSAPGVIDVFVRGNDGALWMRGYDGAWSGWQSLGGQVAPGTGPAACSHIGRFDVFVTGTDGALWHKWYDTANWSGWEHLGGYLTSSPAVVLSTWPSGPPIPPNTLAINMVVRGGNGALWENSWASDRGLLDSWIPFDVL